MKIYFKKFSIMFVMLLAILGVGIIQNGSVANAANVGEPLISPEIGWKRYDDTDSRIKYEGEGWAIGNYVGSYNDNQHGTKTIGDSVKFQFCGTKLRVIAAKWYDGDMNTKVDIDGNVYYFNQKLSLNFPQCMVLDITGLELKIHNVTITKTTNDTSLILRLDAIDIDDTGYLVDSISLDNTSMNLKVSDSKQLTPTTIPAGAQVEWSSSDTRIATVDSTGKVTGLSEGTCTITAKTADGLPVACTVTVTKDESNPPNGGETTTGDANLFIELVDGQIKSYNVSSDLINNFKQWYLCRDNTKSNKPYYEFSKGSYKDYVVHDKIDWFEVR